MACDGACTNQPSALLRSSATCLHGGDLTLYSVIECRAWCTAGWLVGRLDGWLESAVTPGWSAPSQMLSEPLTNGTTAPAFAAVTVLSQTGVFQHLYTKEGNMLQVHGYIICTCILCIAIRQNQATHHTGYPSLSGKPRLRLRLACCALVAPVLVFRPTVDQNRCTRLMQL